ncbi:MAG: ATP-binding cassette domain-containing protein [Nevskia sp.]|nr:ATP-binding cassette domain-containing protein [Nevskia sp.]
MLNPRPSLVPGMAQFIDAANTTNNTLEVLIGGKKWPNGGQLAPLSFSAASGEIVVLSGPPGSGKNSVLRMIAGWDRDYLGSIWYRGRLLQGASREVGFVTAATPLLPWLNIADNVAFGTEANARNTERYARAIDALRTVGLADREAALPSAIPPDEVQRIGIARALYANPGVLLLDDPFSATPSDLRLAPLLRRLADEHRLAIVLSTRNETDAARVAGRLVTLPAIAPPAGIASLAPQLYRDRQ